MYILNNHNIVLQEIPNEISISFNCVGCNLKCKGCHTPELQDIKYGRYLSLDEYKNILDKYKKTTTCVLFMGGEWFEDIYKYLDVAKELNYKTALYTGLDISRIDKNLINKLDFLKYGRFSYVYGGLDNLRTNQVLLSLKDNQVLNHYFHRS